MKPTHRIFGLTIAAGLAFGIGGRAMAQQAPSTRPAPQRPMQRIAPQEWDELMQFMDANSPNRARALRSLNQEDILPLRQTMIQQYRAYKLMRENFPDVADLRLKQFQKEDELYGLTTLQSAGDKPLTFPELRLLIRAKVKEIIDLQLQQEDLRIKRLQASLDEEKGRLQANQTNEPGLIEQRTRIAMARVRATRSLNPNPTGQTRPSDDLADPTVPPTNAPDRTDVNNPTQPAGNDAMNPIDPSGAAQPVPVDGGK